MGVDELYLRLKRIPAILLAFLLVIFATTVAVRQFGGGASGTVTPKNTQVYFSPAGGCTEAVVNTLAAAKSSILVQAYSFTSAPIARALVDAHKRGVKIQVILDKSNSTANYSSADFVAHAGIPTFIDDKHAIAHNKIIIVDSHIVITGSFNFTKAAEEHNAENLLVIDDAILAGRYINSWKNHQHHAAPYQGR